MFTAFIRVIRYGLQNFSRNLWLSGATLAIMILTLLVAEGLVLFNAASRVALQSVQDKIDVSVSVKQEVAEEDILAMKTELETLEAVKSVEYISREKALDLFKERRGSNPIVSQALEELGENPLLASLNIKARDPKEYPQIVEYANKNFAERVEKVSYVETQLLIERLIRITDTVRTFGIAFNIFLAFVAVIVTFNTISLAIYATREEVGIMRLVGASNRFIRGPYVITGILYGLIGALVSIIIAVPFIGAGAGLLEVVLPEFNLQSYFYSNLLTIFLYQVMFGVILGVISSMIAITRYLKV